MVFTLVLSTLLARNDGAVTESGAPRLTSPHKSVRMMDEKISIKVTADKLSASCLFTFVNSGAKSKVKMGFPDHAYGAADPEEEMAPEQKTKPPKEAGMTMFRSWVNGTEIKTALERGAEGGQYWRTKSVSFPGHKKTTVKDVYESATSGGIASFANNRTPSCDFAGYILHTGASWHGTIGRTLVDVELPFEVKKLIDGRSVEVTPGVSWCYTIAPLGDGEVIYYGPCKPEIKGHHLIFIKKNWKPTKKDDIGLLFARQAKN